MSADQVDQQKQFDEENDLGFPLLSDPSKRVLKLFGVKRPGFLPTKRATFVIGQDRKVLDIITSEVNMNAHADKALETLRGLAAA